MHPHHFYHLHHYNDCFHQACHDSNSEQHAFFLWPRLPLQDRHGEHYHPDHYHYHPDHHNCNIGIITILAIIIIFIVFLVVLIPDTHIKINMTTPTS